MISIDHEHTPPNHSPSSHQQQVSHEDFPSVCDIDLLKLTYGNNLDDTNHPLPKFSIRDYVLESRSKNIECNWPFSDRSLQHCLNRGVKNLLPPFQSLDSLRNYSSVSVCAVENHSPNLPNINNFDSKESDNSQCHGEEGLAHIKSNIQPTVRKIKLVMKLNLGEPIEETVVASKVCPVCKTFSSSSNTTLNAHIDSCLSEESSMKPNANFKLKMVKHRIKPRKTRLMVNVYKTAPRCTIEELDKRNGTNWATNSSFPDQELEFQALEKQKEPQKPTFYPEVADKKGAVYIDKNGKKVRILSMPKVNNVNDDEARKLHKGKKGKLVIKKKNKAYGEKNGREVLKLSPSKKKMVSGQKENVVIKESSKKEDGGVKPMKAQVSKQTDELVITRPPWACSKRSSVAKKPFPVHKRRKEDTLLDDSGENLDGSKGSKLSSLKKSLSMPASREHIAGLNLGNLKRKFSAVERSLDSVIQISRAEEDTCERLSHEIKKKKSITSESSKENSSSGGLETTSESAGTIDCVGIEPSFMGLKNSLDNDEFSRMISQLDNKLDDNIIMEEHNTEKQGNYLDEVDPILIPGPPGSFLPPSPGADLGSEEEPQGNSSLTTMSRVQSGEDHHRHDIMNQDFISGSSISTVSSPSIARSIDKLSVRYDNKSVDNNLTNLRSSEAIFTEKGLTSCCCSRKEGDFFEKIASYPQESAVSRERATESNRLTPKFFPLANHLTLPKPEMVKSPVASPTTPVLRLMGKNLFVVNTDNEQVKPPCASPMNEYQHGHPPQTGSMNQCFNIFAPNTSKGHFDLRSGSMEYNATKEVIVIDDSSENEGDDHHHMFKQPMIRNHAFSFANSYGSGSLKLSSSPPREVTNDENRGRLVSTAYHPHSFC